jgi:hypothetical protein
MLRRSSKVLRYLLDEARINPSDSDSLFICVVNLSVKLIRYQLFTVVLVQGFQFAGLGAGLAALV